MKSIQLFDIYAAKVFQKLYENFPSKVDILITEITGQEIDPDQPSKETTIAIDTVIWLKENGYINFKKDHTFFFIDASLTEKGLAILKLPDSLKPEKTLGDRLTNLLKTSGTEAVKEIVRLIISHGAGL